MKFNPDCVRDILLYVEEQPTNDIYIKESLPQQLSRYSFDEVKYHAEQCNLSHFFIGYKYTILGEIKVRALSPAGNQFLANIRSDTVWKRVKDTASSVGSFSMDFLSKVAASVVAELIKKQLG